VLQEYDRDMLVDQQDLDEFTSQFENDQEFSELEISELEFSKLASAIINGENPLAL